MSHDVQERPRQGLVMVTYLFDMFIVHTGDFNIGAITKATIEWVRGALSLGRRCEAFDDRWRYCDDSYWPAQCGGSGLVSGAHEFDISWIQFYQERPLMCIKPMTQSGRGVTNEAKCG